MSILAHSCSDARTDSKHLKGMLGGGDGGALDWTPDSAYSAPNYTRPCGRRSASGGAACCDSQRALRWYSTWMLKQRVSEVIAGGTAICAANVEGTYHAVSNAARTDGPSVGGLEGTGWSARTMAGRRCTTRVRDQCVIEHRHFEVQIKDDAVCVRL